MALDPADREVVNAARRRQLLDEFDAIERGIGALDVKLTLLTEARRDVVQQLRQLESGD